MFDGLIEFEALLMMWFINRSRGWVSVSTHEPHVDLCYRKVGDGHPLRLWRVTTEVEAPPREVLHRFVTYTLISISILKTVVKKCGDEASFASYTNTFSSNFVFWDFNFELSMIIVSKEGYRWIFIYIISIFLRERSKSVFLVFVKYVFNYK